MTGSAARSDPCVRDFLETGESLFFAVVASGREEGRVPAFLRYVGEDGRLRKVATAEADRLLRTHHPEYLFHSSIRDVDLHGVPVSRVYRHHQPRLRVARLVKKRDPDALEAKALGVLETFRDAGILIDDLGITGSLLLDAHTEGSDIDLVVYDRTAFARVRQAIREATASGDFEALDEGLWQDAFERRGCSLSLEEYIWHERRKNNKLVIGGTKVDVSLVTPGDPARSGRWRKVAWTGIGAEVTDDRAGFDYPARFAIRHPEVSEVVSYTNTFTGQARTGETMQACGWLERSESGVLRLVVGSSREAPGEFIKVVRS